MINILELKSNLRIPDTGACAAGMNYTTGGSDVSPVTTYVQPLKFKIFKAKDRSSCFILISLMSVGSVVTITMRVPVLRPHLHWEKF